MNEYINNWLTIIENMRNDNTYKLDHILYRLSRS